MRKALLVLEDGTQYPGFSFGHDGPSDGEVVFNTGMVGYPESLTDPSYRGQILVMTYPLVGNYGVPGDEKQNGLSTVFESDQIHIRGLVVSEYSQHYHHWRAQKSLAEFLKAQKIPAITGIDTRSLTKKLREKGVMLGRIMIAKKDETDTFPPKINPDQLAIKDPNQQDLVAEATVDQVRVYGNGPKKVICVDCGMKNNILHQLLRQNLTIKRVPSTYDFTQEEFDGLFISNGPGDPQQNSALIERLRQALTKDKPIFGICLGNQIMALAAGAKTYKLKYGHRSQNQPCLELGTNRCYLTSQNHGFAVDEKTLGPGWEPWFRNANDNTNEGIRHKNGRFFAVQFHPEACPGPEDTEWLYKKFAQLL